MKQVSLLNGESFPAMIRGLWQLSQGHRRLPVADIDPLASLMDAHQRGFTTFDVADIYQGVEELLGQLRASTAGTQLRVHTKYVPDQDQLEQISFSYTQKIIDRSLSRLKMESLDLVQFHWWDYQKRYYLDALEHLARLQELGKIRSIGLTNFDTIRLQEIISAGFPIATIQLQASLLDKRSFGAMAKLCQQHGIKRLGYGSVMGGLLSEKWLGQKELREEEMENRSLVKYKLIIDDWGGWQRFQDFLLVLQRIAQKYQVSITQVAIQSMLQGGCVDAVIVGLSQSRYREQNIQLCHDFTIDEKDLVELLSWDSPLQGDVYELERQSKHARIMRTQLNR